MEKDLSEEPTSKENEVEKLHPRILAIRDENDRLEKYSKEFELTKEEADCLHDFFLYHKLPQEDLTADQARLCAHFHKFLTRDVFSVNHQYLKRIIERKIMDRGF